MSVVDGGCPTYGNGWGIHWEDALGPFQALWFSLHALLPRPTAQCAFNLSNSQRDAVTDASRHATPPWNAPECMERHL